MDEGLGGKKEYRLKRPNNYELRFTGKEVARVELPPLGSNVDDFRELVLYLTDGGTYVLVQIRRPGFAAHFDTTTIETDYTWVCESVNDLRGKLKIIVVPSQLNGEAKELLDAAGSVRDRLMSDRGRGDRSQKSRGSRSKLT